MKITQNVHPSQTALVIRYADVPIELIEYVIHTPPPLLKFYDNVCIMYMYAFYIQL